MERQGRYENVVAAHPGCGAAPGVLVASHYDTVPGTPGADDNASAVAVSLACARALAGCPGELPVAFVCFNREEDGLLGSRDFVQQLSREERDAVRVAHVLEMVGYASRGPGSQRLPEGLPVRAPTTGDFLALLSNRMSNRLMTPLVRQARAYCPSLHVVGVKVYLGLEKYLTDLLRSDHVPFWQAGIPALMWTDTSEFRNPNYHRHTDSAETLDYEFMGNIARLLLASVVSSCAFG